MWKSLISIIADEIFNHLEENDFFIRGATEVVEISRTSCKLIKQLFKTVGEERLG